MEKGRAVERHRQAKRKAGKDKGGQGESWTRRKLGREKR